MTHIPDRQEPQAEQLFLLALAALDQATRYLALAALNQEGKTV
jgi:hypothetical protein